MAWHPQRLRGGGRKVQNGESPEQEDASAWGGSVRSFPGDWSIKGDGSHLRLGEREKNENEQGCCIAVGLASGLSLWTHGFQYKVIAPGLDVKVGACK